MKKVILLGDSIRQIGYGAKVEELLKDEYTVWQPNDNCRYSLYTLRCLFDWSRNMHGADIIHWNNGMWDLSDLYGEGRLVSVEDYVRTMLRIHEVMSRYTKNIIFATTTPVREPYQYQNNAVVKMYNAAIVPELKARGVRINDLYSFIEPHIDEYIRDDDRLHLTETGISHVAPEVARVIREADNK